MWVLGRFLCYLLWTHQLHRSRFLWCTFLVMGICLCCSSCMWPQFRCPLVLGSCWAFIFQYWNTPIKHFKQWENIQWCQTRIPKSPTRSWTQNPPKIKAKECHQPRNSSTEKQETKKNNLVQPPVQRTHKIKCRKKISNANRTTLPCKPWATQNM